jgi:S1-C subfamily serine protease
VTWVDAAVLAWVLLSALIGFQRGLAAQLLSLAGLALGGFVGARVGPLLLPAGGDSPWLPLASLIGAVVGAILLQAAASIAGARVRDKLATRSPLRAADGAGGIVLGAGIGLAVAWLVAVAALQLDRPALRAAVRDSAILSGLVDAVPPRSVLRTLARIDPLPLISAPPDLRLPEPNASVLESRTARAAAASVVKVHTLACGSAVQGSGWVIGPELVATNVHVVTGAEEVLVAAPSAEMRPATVVHVDARDDVALLSVEGLSAPPLELARAAREGEDVVLLGYPGDGALMASAGTAGRPAKVFAADAYGRRAGLRTVVPLRGVVERGDSGGPVVNRRGRVVAMIFAASTEGAGGFGVPPSEIRSALEAPRSPVEPGPCPG